MCKYYRSFLLVSKIFYWCQADSSVWSLSDHKTQVLLERKAAKMLMIVLSTKMLIPVFSKMFYPFLTWKFNKMHFSHKECSLYNLYTSLLTFNESKHSKKKDKRHNSWSS